MTEAFIRQELTSSDANRLRKWVSLRSDLTHVRQVLFMRQQLPNTLEHMFTRRALWESAIVSYGRMGTSDKRQVEFRTFVTEIGGTNAEKLHEELMAWRHEHVAHRTGAQFEETVVEAFFDGHGLNHLNVDVSTSVGPANDSDFAQRFHDHVDRLRNHLWENYMEPSGAALAERDQKGDAPTESTPKTQTPEDRANVTVTLWDRVNGIGLAAPPTT